MIVLGNYEFATGMRFAGVKSFTVKSREQALEILRQVEKEEFIIVNVSVEELVPELDQFKNVVAIPDDVSQLNNIDDLKHIIKSAIGIELEVV